MPRLRALAAESFAFRAARAVHPEAGPAAGAVWTGRPGSETGAMLSGQPIRREVPLATDWIAEHTTADVFCVGRLGSPGRRSSARVSTMLASPAAGAAGNLAVAQAAAQVLANQPPGRPWLGVVALQGLSQLEPTVAAWGALKRAPELGLSESALPRPVDRTVPDGEPSRWRRVARAGVPNPDWEDDIWRHLRWMALRCLAHTDRCIANVIEALDATVHATDAVVVVMSACGHPFGQHGLMAPGVPYSHTLDIPLLVRGLGRGGSDALVSGLDVVPTICDLLGAPQLPGAHGYSLRPLLEQTSSSWRRSIVSEAHIDGRVVRSDEFAYVWYPDDEHQLFHVRNDPLELRNLALDAGYAGAVQQHRSFLEAYALRLQPTAEAEAGWPPTRD